VHETDTLHGELLPFLEQNALHERVLRFNLGGGSSTPSWWPDTTDLETAAATRVEAYLCPSETLAGGKMTKSQSPTASFYRYFWGNNTANNTEYHGTNYKSVLGSQWPVNGISLANGYASAGGRFTWTDTWADAGIDYGNGPFPSGRRCGRVTDYTLTAFANVTDGLSNTFGFGEASIYWQGSPAWVDPQTIGATMGIPLNHYKTWKDKRTEFTNENNWNWSFGFSSMHPGGATFASLDGAVKFVNETVSQQIYLAAGTIDCGEAQALP